MFIIIIIIVLGHSSLEKNQVNKVNVEEVIIHIPSKMVSGHN